MQYWLYQMYSRSQFALGDDCWREKIFRHCVIWCDRIVSTWVFQVFCLAQVFRKHSKRTHTNQPGGYSECLLAVYSLTSNPLTFDFVTFFGTAELKRIQCGAKRVRVVVYAPAVFPIYQWMRRKIFSNTGNQPLILASHENALKYVAQLTSSARILATSIQVEIISRQQELELAVSQHSLIFPGRARVSGHFDGATAHRTYSQLKHSINHGCDAVRRSPRSRLLSQSGDKLCVTVNLRNQGYVSTRDADMAAWQSFFSNSFIKSNFNFIVFNDAENPVDLADAACVTFRNQYIADNFRRFKLMLDVGLHIGCTSGAAAIVSISEMPYLLIGKQRVEDIEGHIDPSHFLLDSNILLYDCNRPHQRFSLAPNRIMQDVKEFLEIVASSPLILGKYPPNFRSNILRILATWPLTSSGTEDV